MRPRSPASSQARRCKPSLETPKKKEWDVPLAWKLADSITAMAPKPQQQFERFKSDLLVAAVLARAGLGDSAKRVVDRSRGNPDIDPNLELPQFAAFVGALRGDTTAALADLVDKPRALGAILLRRWRRRKADRRDTMAG